MSDQDKSAFQFEDWKDLLLMHLRKSVKRVDNMTMAWGLEARVPFLDHELVELAAMIPAEFKVANGGKHILKEAAREIIPSKVIDRPKGYFPVPALTYLHGEYLDVVREIMLSPRNSERELLPCSEKQYSSAGVQMLGKKYIWNGRFCKAQR